jgi:PIN domain nuclease of toxin-antitoxin system
MDQHARKFARAGHDRMVIRLTRENVDRWLTPQGHSDEELQAILSERQPAARKLGSALLGPFSVLGISKLLDSGDQRDPVLLAAWVTAAGGGSGGIWGSLLRLLLDTQVFIWSVMDSRQLKVATRRYLASAEIVYVSAASIWEIALKTRIGKMTGDVEAFAAAIDASGFQELPVTARHAAAVAKLPLIHADPFDRMLIAQAFLEPLRLVTADKVLIACGGAVEFI